MDLIKIPLGTCGVVTRGQTDHENVVKYLLSERLPPFPKKTHRKARIKNRKCRKSSLNPERETEGILRILAAIVSTAANRCQCYVQHEHFPLFRCQSEDTSNAILLFYVILASSFITSRHQG